MTNENTEILTIQKTKKKLKLHSVLSSLIVVIGSVIVFFGYSFNVFEEGNHPFLLLFAVISFLIGLFWFIVNRVRIWWNHE